MSWLNRFNPFSEEWQKQTAGTVGKAINTIGSALGNPLPERNLSESLQSFGGSPGEFVWVKPAYAAESSGGASGSWDAGSTNAGSTDKGGIQRVGSPGGGGQPTPTTNEPGYFINQPSGPSMEEIENAYQARMGSIGAIQGAAEAQYGVTQKGIESEYAQAKPELEAGRTREMERLGQGRTEAQSAEKSQIAKSRRLYNELRQQEMARLSAMGLSSSSVAEGSMEMLGRDVAGQMGGARQEATKVLASIAGEEREIERWFTQQATNLENNKIQALDKARADFNTQLASIDAMRAAAAEDKANARIDAMWKLRDETQRINEFNAQMALSLDQWRTQKQQMLDEAKAKTASVANYAFTPDQISGSLSGLPLSRVTATVGKAPTYYYGGTEEEQNPFTTGQ